MFYQEVRQNFTTRENGQKSCARRKVNSDKNRYFAHCVTCNDVTDMNHMTADMIVKPVRRACARGSKFGQDASLTHVASRRARAVRAKCSLAGLTTVRIKICISYSYRRSN